MSRHIPLTNINYHLGHENAPCRVYEVKFGIMAHNDAYGNKRDSGAAMRIAYFIAFRQAPKNL